MLILDDFGDDTPPTPEQCAKIMQWYSEHLRISYRQGGGAIGPSRLPWAYDSRLSVADWGKIKATFSTAKIAVARLLDGIREPVTTAEPTRARIVITKHISKIDADKGLAKIDKILSKDDPAEPWGVMM